MDKLTQETLAYLRSQAKITPSILATPDEVAYFGSALTAKKKPVFTNLSSGFISSESIEICDEILPIFSETHSQRTMGEEKSAKDRAKIIDSEGDKPRTEVTTEKAIRPPIAVCERKNPQPDLPPILSSPIQQKNLVSVVKNPPFKPAASTTPLKPPSNIRFAVQKALPDFILRESSLDDGLAKKMARLWEETYLSAKVVIIAFGQTGTGLEFLKNVTDAIDRLLAPAQLIDGVAFEKEHSWELLLNSPLLHTVISSPWASWKTTSLAKHYRQNGASQDHFLGKRPLLILEPIQHYLNNPELKRNLWKNLNTHLSS